MCVDVAVRECSEDVQELDVRGKCVCAIDSFGHDAVKVSIEKVHMTMSVRLHCSVDHMSLTSCSYIMNHDTNP